MVEHHPDRYGTAGKFRLWWSKPCGAAQNQESAFYQSDRFHQLLVWVQQNPNRVNMKEKQTKNGLRLRLAFNKVSSVKQAIDLFPDLE